MGVAVAGTAAGELALVVIPALEGTAQRGRDRAGPASHVEHVAVGAVEQHHQPPASQATRRAASLPTWMPPACSMTAWPASGPGAAAVGPPPCAAAARWRLTAGSMGAWPAAASAAGAAGSGAGGSIARVSAEVSAAALAGSRQRKVSASTCTVTWKRSPGLPGSSPPASAALGHQSQRIRASLRDARLVSLRGRGAPAPVNDSLRLSWREIVPAPL